MSDLLIVLHETGLSSGPRPDLQRCDTGWLFKSRAHSVLVVRCALAFGLAAFGSAAQAATFDVTIELPGVQSFNQGSLCAAIGAGACTVGIERFDTRPLGNGQTFSTTYGTGGVISGTYSDVTVVPAGVYGGSAGSGNYAVTYTSGGYQVSLATTLASGINYFGYWLSALDQGNTVTFFNGATQVYQFTPGDLINRVGVCPDASNAYCGNPTAAFQEQVSNESFAFVNFFDRDGTFDSIVFAENPAAGGYESDNHTVGYVTGTSGVSVTPVPEPASLTLLGAGVAGLVMARRRARGATANTRRQGARLPMSSAVQGSATGAGGLAIGRQRPTLPMPIISVD